MIKEQSTQGIVFLIAFLSLMILIAYSVGYNHATNDWKTLIIRQDSNYARLLTDYGDCIVKRIEFLSDTRHAGSLWFNPEENEALEND